MTASELIDLFLNSLLGNFVLPLQDEILWFSLLIFRPEAMALPTVVAVIASALGLIASYGLGQLIARNRRNMRLPEAQYQKAARLSERYLVCMLLIPWLPFLGLFALIFGFLHVPLSRLLPCIVVGRILYYGYYLSMG